MLKPLDDSESIDDLINKFRSISDFSSARPSFAKFHSPCCLQILRDGFVSSGNAVQVLHGALFWRFNAADQQEEEPENRVMFELRESDVLKGKNILF